MELIREFEGMLKNLEKLKQETLQKLEGVEDNPEVKGNKELIDILKRIKEGKVDSKDLDTLLRIKNTL